MEKIPTSMQPHLVPIDKYFDSMPNCGSFFYYSGTGKKVNISLDNPREPYSLIMKKVD